ARYAAFGFNAIVVDGHNFEELINALETARNTKDKPTAIIAKTFKGQGIEGVADQLDWHGKPVPLDKVNAIKARLHGSQKGKLVAKKPTDDAPKVDLHIGSIKMAPPEYKKGDKVATRAAYGTALAKLGDVNPRVIGLDGDTKNSTYSEKLLKKHPDQFIECFIAEQNLVGVAVGAQCRDRTIPFTSTFAAFFTRACDQIRMAAVSFANLKCAGSHVGVSIGEDGPSQMALEDLALFRAVPGSTVFYPTDAVSAERATELAANIKGIVFIRTGRPALPVLYDNNEPFAVGKAKACFYNDLCPIVKMSPNDKITLIGAGVTIYEIMKAADELEKQGVHCCIIDPFTIKPLDEATIVEHAKRTGGKIITVEDHYPAGGIGEAVSACVSDHGIRVHSLCVQDVPRSGKPEELIDLFGISARHIVEAVKKF
ncbi:unnamed protein product, partial [Strongylus vulgaris]